MATPQGNSQKSLSSLCCPASLPFLNAPLLFPTCTENGGKPVKENRVVMFCNKDRRHLWWLKYNPHSLRLVTWFVTLSVNICRFGLILTAFYSTVSVQMLIFVFLWFDVFIHWFILKISDLFKAKFIACNISLNKIVVQMSMGSFWHWKNSHNSCAFSLLFNYNIKFSEQWFQSDPKQKITVVNFR